MSEELERAYEWLRGADKGCSSETIWSVMTGLSLANLFAMRPSDRYDFGRCYRLLEKMPEWKSRMGEVAGTYPRWSLLCQQWQILTTLYEQGLQNDNFADFDALLCELNKKMDEQYRVYRSRQ